MLENAKDVKEISYAHSAQSKGGRTIIKHGEYDRSHWAA